MTRRESITTLATVYIGTVIGAGFASGQEIMQFFGEYGIHGILGVGVSTILIMIIASTILKRVYRQNIHSFEEFASFYFTKRILWWVNILLAFLLLVGYFVMLAGAGAVTKHNLGIAPLYGIVIMSVINFIVFQFGVRGIAKANNFIVPILISIIFLVSFFVVKNNNFIFSNVHGEVLLKLDNITMLSKSMIQREIVFTHFGWIASSVVYAAHNSIGAIVVMTSFRPVIYDEKAAKYGGLLGGLGLGILALLILISILTLYTDVMGLEVPMVAAAHSLGEIPKNIYSIVLLLAMFTTAIANGYACILRLSFITGIRKNYTMMFICLASIPLAMLGFKNLVSFFYPIFGYMGFFFIVAILFKKK
ncbi:MAG: hypothetical protein JJT76_03775 [Clostridiaceae bacterium]|nr:hypothetical protein [Clostridiaceae bacterium]